MTKEEIETLYNLNRVTPSDINEHLPILKEYYDKCESICEMGVRGCVSLSAALASNAKRVVAYDIANVAVPDCEKLTFICADVLQVQIEETDFLFIDTYHVYAQLQKELNLHGYKARKYIGFHDTQIFGEHGEDGGVGLKPAIQNFISNGDWIVVYNAPNNNGLTIIKRI